MIIIFYICVKIDYIVIYKCVMLLLLCYYNVFVCVCSFVNVFFNIYYYNVICYM